jgi:hypothetical protein
VVRRPGTRARPPPGPVECDVAARHLTILERRAPWREDFGPEWTTFPIARLRYTAADKTWTLFRRYRDLVARGRWSDLNRAFKQSLDVELTFENLRSAALFTVARGGVEPPTFRFSGVRSMRRR